ncbi:MAG TPA: family 16 glycoside hydrolase [Gemmataceae bacterium]|nr:family 16 glycoside hydrolase [Gemmataceae bacterium]
MRWPLISAMFFLVAAQACADERGITVRFQKEDEGKIPAGWKVAKTGKGEGSDWKVVADATAPSKTGYALAQLAKSPGGVFNLCVRDEPSLTDVEVSVAFKAVAGKEDQGGGIVWRYQDANNYYVARMNPLEDNFRVYKVQDGKRSQFQNFDIKIPSGEWHTLKIKMQGDHIECFLDGMKHLDVKDSTFDKPGKAGLWTKADAQTHFDQFTVSGK